MHVCMRACMVALSCSSGFSNGSGNIHKKNGGKTITSSGQLSQIKIIYILIILV